MHDTTESPMMLAGGFPPPSDVNVPPVLPRVAATPSPVATPVSNPFATSMNGSTPPRAPQHRSSGGGRRFVSWMLVLAVLGGLTAAGIVYGPEIMDRVTGDESLNEPDAPLAFPTPTVPLAPIRSASYTVQSTSPAGQLESYTVTTDYETGATQTIVERADRPDLEILTLFDGAVARLVGEATWYSLPRGEFPLGQSLGRTRWVRTLDELFPPELRTRATIDRSTEAVIENADTRHLVISMNPGDLVPVPSTAPVPPAADAAPLDLTAVVEIPTPAPGIDLWPDTDPNAPLSIELWVDTSGLVRKLELPAPLGGETITVTSVSSEAYLPTFPAFEVLQPLTADALFHLTR
ncbi:MAG: hypothetical protein WBP59_08325 [Ilumatobacteraceae bacterium]